MKATITVRATAEKNFTLDEMMELFTPEEMKELAADMIRSAHKPEIKPDALYTCNEVATVTGTSRSTIQRAVNAGCLKPEYIGSELRIRGAAINEWLKQGGKTSRSRRDLIEEAGG
jgi:excisionase family DNA binding protein